MKTFALTLQGTILTPNRRIHLLLIILLTECYLYRKARNKGI